MIIHLIYITRLHRFFWHWRWIQLCIAAFDHHYHLFNNVQAWVPALPHHITLLCIFPTFIRSVQADEKHWEAIHDPTALNPKGRPRSQKMMGPMEGHNQGGMSSIILQKVRSSGQKCGVCHQEGSTREEATNWWLALINTRLKLDYLMKNRQKYGHKSLLGWHNQNQLWLLMAFTSFPQVTNLNQERISSILASVPQCQSQYLPTPIVIACPSCLPTPHPTFLNKLTVWDN